MKKYKCIAPNDADDVFDLVNIEDETDVLWGAPDNFVVGEIYNEDDLRFDYAPYVDEQGVGTAQFAFNKNIEE